MSNLVIVAIPAADDRIWKISSEKVPHLTMLFLGEETNDIPRLSRIVDFVEHAVKVQEHGPFYLDVDHRDILGEDKADVLHFRKDWSFKWISQLRSQLLQQPDIKTAYDSIEQFPEWRPHLTLGYPESPAKEFDESIYSVSFDRIAVWPGDFEGPEFRLERSDEFMNINDVAWGDISIHSESLEESMSQVAVRGEEFLNHYGVKGMRWGQRKEDRPAESKQGLFDPEGHSLKGDLAKAAFVAPIPVVGLIAAPAQIRLIRGTYRGSKAYMEHRKQPEEVAKREKRRLERRDSFWEAHAYSDISHADVHNQVADEIDSKVYQLQKAPKYRGKNLKTDASLANEYSQDVAKVTDAAYRRAVKDTYGTNPSETKEAHYVNDVRGARIEIRDRNTGKTFAETELKPVSEDVRTEEEVGHAALAHVAKEDPLVITVKTDAAGFITKIGRVKLPEDEDKSFAQTADLGAEFLQHYGVKGMKWGVRRNNALSVHLEKAQAKREVARREVRQPRDVHARDTIGLTPLSKTKIKSHGGEDHPAAEDAVKVAVVEQKLKKSGSAALSNNELRVMAERLQLEANVSRLQSERVQPGQGFVKGILRKNAKKEADRSSGRVFNEIGDKALKTAFGISPPKKKKG